MKPRRDAPATGSGCREVWQPGPVRLPDLAPAEWSIRVVDVAQGSVLASLDAGRVLRTASVGKLFLLVEAARQATAGELDLAERVQWQDDERVEDSGLWYLLDQRELSVRDLCVLVGAVSDNLATNVLVRVVGLSAVAARTAALGYTDSGLLDRVRDERGPSHPPTLSVGTAADLSDLMGRLHGGEVVDREVSALVLRWLAANTDLSMVASAFDLDPLAHAEPDGGLRRPRELASRRRPQGRRPGRHARDRPGDPRLRRWLSPLPRAAHVRVRKSSRTCRPQSSDATGTRSSTPCTPSATRPSGSSPSGANPYPAIPSGAKALASVPPPMQ